MTGELRRPPQLWEEKLARTTSILGVGIGSGDATSIVTEPPTPGTDGGVEPAPSLPPEDEFLAPSTPTLSGTVQGIRVSWNGLDKDGDPYPSGAFVEVHISTTGATFTPDATTLAGTLLGSAGFFTIGALTAGTTYYVRLVGVDEAGNRTDPSTAASSQTGLTTTNDYGTATIGSGAVSFDARAIGGITTTVGTTAPSSPVTGDIWLDSTGGAIVHKRWSGLAWVTQAWGSSSISANAITAVQIAAGAITAGAIAANAITADKIEAGAVKADKIEFGAISGDKISANAIDGKTITGATVRTAASGARVVFDSTGIKGFDSSNTERFSLSASTGSASITGDFRTGVTGARVEIGNTFGVISAARFFTSAGDHGTVGAGVGTGELLINPVGRTQNNGNLLVSGETATTTLQVSNQAVDMPGASGNAGATTADTGWNGSRLRAKSSNQALKYDIATVDGNLEGVDEPRRLEVVTVDPADVLNIGVAEFSWLEEGEPTEWRELGFIAQDVAAKFPIAASINAEGEAIAVRDTPLIAALLTVVKQQQAQIEDLTARIEALED